jgi:hypothetical protein
MAQISIILTHENIFVGLRPTIAKKLSVFSCVSNQQPARKAHFFSRLKACLKIPKNAKFRMKPLQFRAEIQFSNTF